MKIEMYTCDSGKCTVKTPDETTLFVVTIKSADTEVSIHMCRKCLGKAGLYKYLEKDGKVKETTGERFQFPYDSSDSYPPDGG